MHGLVNRAIERFVRDIYGRDIWVETIRRFDLGYTEFEAMMTYEPQVTKKVVTALGGRLDKAVPDLLKDIGTYMISHPNIEVPRWLLRFGGVDLCIPSMICPSARALPLRTLICRCLNRAIMERAVIA